MGGKDLYTSLWVCLVAVVIVVVVVEGWMRMEREMRNEARCYWARGPGCVTNTTGARYM